MKHQFSVVVVTRDRPQLLKKTLISLLEQHYLPMHYEVLVVENGANSPKTKELLTALQRKYSHLRYVSLAQPGISLARNEGVRLAKYSTVVMVDDDVIVPPEFLAAYARAWKKYPDAVVVGGRVKAHAIEHTQLSNEERRILEMKHWCHAVLDYGANDRDLEPGMMLYTANLSFRRDAVLKSYDGQVFTQYLGVWLYDKVQLGAEDFELCTRNVSGGKQVVYVADRDLAVEHYVSRSRLTRGYIKRRYIQAGIEMYILDQVLKQQFPQLESFYLNRFRRPRAFLRLLRDWNELTTFICFILLGRYFSTIVRKT